ncbi:hypothetical protein EPI10_014200 [Gossypium australe]|uniref:Uncharacterized protein n=1 Tax=Gossypium australe TaxID=47621 RepID=A0A5B6VGN1_9ROSI|nr:hypothetical protein EPI10_014200 [Gossypium australe]
MAVGKGREGHGGAMVAKIMADMNGIDQMKSSKTDGSEIPLITLNLCHCYSNLKPPLPPLLSPS